MIKKYFIFLLLATTLLSVTVAATESAFEYPLVQSGQVLLELKQPLPGNPKLLTSQPVKTGLSDLDNLLAEIGANSVELFVPRHLPSTYLIQFNPQYRVEAAVNLLKSRLDVADVWPCPLVPMLGLKYNPDDLLLPSQWHINQIHAPEAWASLQGFDCRASRHH